jgi:hypothetical protein
MPSSWTNWFAKQSNAINCDVNAQKHKNLFTNVEYQELSPAAVVYDADPLLALE